MANPLEQIYPCLPVWAQTLGISLWGYAWRHERLGGSFERYVDGFRERDRWQPARMREYVAAELGQTLLHAFDEVPYYGRVWRNHGLTRSKIASLSPADLSRLPVTPKSDLRATPEDFVAQDVARRQRLHRYFSSGSTGTPVTAICTSDGHRRMIAAREVRSFGWAGASVREPRSMLGGRLVVPKSNARPPFHRYNWAERQVYFSAFHITLAHVAEYVRAFDHYRPRVLTGYAYSHYVLARMMNEKGITLAYEPAALVLSSERLAPQMKTVIRQAFRARAFEEYGSVENCALATECEHGSLHINPDFGIVEIVDETGQPVGPGQEGRILCTGLLNEAQPLIRYEIGDMGKWSSKSCPCGRDHLPILEELVGRLEDAVVGPDGREVVRFHGIFIDLPHVLEGQIVQRALDRYLVRVVASDGFGDEEKRLIRSRFEQRLGPVAVQIERVPEIPRTERGKFRSVICEIPPEERRVLGALAKVEPAPRVV